IRDFHVTGVQTCALPIYTFWPGLLVSVLFALEFALLYPGLQHTTAAHAVILLYTSPFVVALGAHFLIPGDRLTTAKVAGLLLAWIWRGSGRGRRARLTAT